jgi:hypothetical protein
VGRLETVRKQGRGVHLVTMPSRHTSFDMRGDSSSRGDTRWKPNEPVKPRWMVCDSFNALGRSPAASLLMTSSNGGMNSLGCSSSLRPAAGEASQYLRARTGCVYRPTYWRFSRHVALPLLAQRTGRPSALCLQYIHLFHKPVAHPCVVWENEEDTQGSCAPTSQIRRLGT